MTTEDIKERIKKIKSKHALGDHEAAHSEEDTLREDFIKSIAQDQYDCDLIKNAKLVLSTSKLAFNRWCA